MANLTNEKWYNPLSQDQDDSIMQEKIQSIEANLEKLGHKAKTTVRTNEGPLSGRKINTGHESVSAATPAARPDASNHRVDAEIAAALARMDAACAESKKKPVSLREYKKSLDGYRAALEAYHASLTLYEESVNKYAAMVEKGGLL